MTKNVKNGVNHMTSKIEIEIETHTLDKINKDLQERNKDLDDNKKFDLSQYVGLILERLYVEKEYEIQHLKLYALAGKLQALENSIAGKKAKKLFEIDDVIDTQMRLKK